MLRQPHPYRALLLVWALVVSTLCLQPLTAFAAPQELTITPTSLTQTITPGKTYNGSFQILNRGEAGYNYKVYPSAYSVKGEAYTPDFQPIKGAPDVASWFSIPTKTGYVKPGQSITVNFSIAMPAGTPPGGYYATIFTETQYPRSDQGITLNQRVGEIFYLQAAGKVKESGQVDTWKAGLLQSSPLVATLRLRNDGGVHYAASAQVQVRDVFGNTKYALNTTKQVLPQTIRSIPVQWDKSPAIGLFKVTGSVNLLGNGQTLPTKWVLVMSPLIRVIVLLLFATAVAAALRKPVVKNRTQHKKKIAKKE
ncbi:MAG: exported protein of unknown function [Candidatus Saccharibacteria bacterium]|nr:exported protein of unknown function [Candidatus Saccharibacteria bacterium]